MKYTFQCYGHPNIKAKHYRTIEFTKDEDLTPSGDCILGIRANFEKAELKKLSGKIRIIVEVGSLSDTFHAVINPYFDDDHEIVFRKSLYQSKRTLGHFLNKGANRLDRAILKCLQSSDTLMTVTIEETGKRRSNTEAHKLLPISKK